VVAAGVIGSVFGLAITLEEILKQQRPFPVSKLHDLVGKKPATHHQLRTAPI
jgi:hypothetical protein